MNPHIIYKYEVDVSLDTNIFSMPRGAVVLHVQAVNDIVCLWARVKPDGVEVKRGFAVVSTGRAMAPQAALGIHVGSAVILNGRYVAHIFDLGEVTP